MDEVKKERGKILIEKSLPQFLNLKIIFKNFYDTYSKVFMTYVSMTFIRFLYITNIHIFSRIFMKVVLKNISKYIWFS